MTTTRRHSIKTLQRLVREARPGACCKHLGRSRFMVYDKGGKAIAGGPSTYHAYRNSVVKLLGLKR